MHFVPVLSGGLWHYGKGFNVGSCGTLTLPAYFCQTFPVLRVYYFDKYLQPQIMTSCIILCYHEAELVQWE
jgi:hypothetical protein